MPFDALISSILLPFIPSGISIFVKVMSLSKDLNSSVLATKSVWHSNFAIDKILFLN